MRQYLHQIGMATLRAFDDHRSTFFLQYSFDADVLANAGTSYSSPRVPWEDVLNPYMSDFNSDVMYRCPDDPSVPRPDPSGNGIRNRTSYLLNSQVSKKTRRYGRWTLLRVIQQVGTSNFISFVERDADGLAAAGCDPRQDEFDIWLGTATFQPWIAFERHTQAANYLYLVGHVNTLFWSDAVPDFFPDHHVLTQNSTYPF